jgi:uncharacterized protein YdhG (YjbR/CyaY superfamily)
MAINSVDQYIDSFPTVHQMMLNQLRKLVEKTYPEAIESMSYGMIGYKLQKKPMVYFGAHQLHIGVYATPEANIAFAEDLKGFVSGKGSIQFPIDKPLPLDLIERIVKFKGEGIKKKYPIK